MDWTSGDKNLSVTSGVGMPFLYFEKSEQEEVSIKVNSGNATIQNNKLIIENASHGADFVVFAPSG
jgi:endo-1,3(4)-beta-glucanase